MFQLLDAVHKRQAVTFAIQWKTQTTIILSRCQALLGFTANNRDFTFKHLIVALVLATKVRTVVMKVAICPISFSFGQSRYQQNRVPSTFKKPLLGGFCNLGLITFWTLIKPHTLRG